MGGADPSLRSAGPVQEAARTIAQTLDSSDRGWAERVGLAMPAFERCVRGPLLDHIPTTNLSACIEADDLPIPPADRREGYYAHDDVVYWLSGLADRFLLESIGRELGNTLRSGIRFLDFGSSSGRLLRHVVCAHPGIDAFGSDIGAASVDWARHNLSPRVNIALNGHLPHLPFPDGFFDWVYAGSVFSHISDFEEAWLLELARVVAPGGVAFISFHPPRLWQWLGENQDHQFCRAMQGGRHRLDPGAIEVSGAGVFRAPMVGDRVVLTLNIDGDAPNVNTYHSHRWIEDRWVGPFRLDRVIVGAHSEFQDAAVLVRNAG